MPLVGQRDPRHPGKLMVILKRGRFEQPLKEDMTIDEVRAYIITEQEKARSVRRESDQFQDYLKHLR